MLKTPSETIANIKSDILPSEGSGSLPIRGVHIDCRAQMLRFDRLKMIYEDLARWGYNTVLFEYEDRFPYRGDLKDIAAPDALTRRDIKELNQIASDNGIRIIPLVQCLGHLEYVLRLKKYRPICECKGNGRDKNFVPDAVCPSRKTPTRLFRHMVEQVLELHDDARYFHMGGDEVRLLDTCPRCGPRLKSEGVSRVLVDYYLQCAEWLRKQGPNPIIWGDLLLAHPKHLADLRGQVIVMDWDYWSLASSSKGRQRKWDSIVWGARACDWRVPESWPDELRQRFATYMFNENGSQKPFPYTAYLRDQGFQVITASAARAAGDTFAAPAGYHLENAIAGSRVAMDTNALGHVVTSWALRRGAWPLTHRTLMTAAAAMRIHPPSCKAMAAAYAWEHLGTADATLAEITHLLGITTGGLDIFAAQNNIHLETGQRYGTNYARCVEQVRSSGASGRKHCRLIIRNVAKARQLLALAKPLNRRQLEAVKLWHLAADVLEYYADFGLALLKKQNGLWGTIIRRFRDRATPLHRQTEQALTLLYTDRTVSDEMKVRFDVHIDWLDEELARLT